MGELFVRHLDGWFIHDNLFVAFDGEVRQVLEDRLDVQRLAFIDCQFRHLGLPNRTNAKFADAVAEAFRQQTVNNFFADLACEAAAYDCFGNLARRGNQEASRISDSCA